MVSKVPITRFVDGGEEQLKKTIAHLTGEVDRLTSKQEAEKAERKTLLSDLEAHKADLGKFSTVSRSLLILSQSF